MGTILENIIERKRVEVARNRMNYPIEDLKEHISNLPIPLNLSGALMGDDVRLIAEFKRKSPSKGLLNDKLSCKELAKVYVENGASAISVLTDEAFGGSVSDLADIKEAVTNYRVPVLRKDFMLDPYQVYESRAYGADAILLIVNILTDEELKELLNVAQQLWVQVLVEVHTEPELERAILAGAEIIGINNRDLHTFNVDLSFTEKMAGRIPAGRIIVSESGIFQRSDVELLRKLRVHAMLVGEALMTADDIPAKIKELTSGLN
ncbi:indole-3-glycerol phosphate synthase TrpC [SAR202 cluster bacterium AC-409-J13_OGT_754m]|nr:indole-3-glycerol phosphate synthase TrpC [SAR202 cluster bacterium AC-409-J13_OGT_754m]